VSLGPVVRIKFFVCRFAELLILRLLTLGSEQTQTAEMGIMVSVTYPRKVCPRRAMEETRNRTMPLPFVLFSVILRDAKVFPVPQAIISYSTVGQAHKNRSIHDIT
jgi:hypothetical protein